MFGVLAMSSDVGKSVWHGGLVHCVQFDEEYRGVHLWCTFKLTPILKRSAAETTEPVTCLWCVLRVDIRDVLYP